MKIRKLLVPAAPLVVGAIAALNVTLAQAADTDVEEQPGITAEQTAPENAARTQHDPGAYVLKRLTHLKEKLQITPDQEPQWQAFSDTVVQQTQQLRSAHRTRQAAPAKAPERIDRQVELMKQRVAGFEAIAQSAKTLYAALTPAQQQVADERLLRFNRKHAG